MGHINNPEVFDQSPIGNANGYVHAEKPSITFQQLKCKYGFVNHPHHLDLRDQRLDDQYNYEDVKDEQDQEYFNVPEEHEEDPPLRLKGKMIDSPVKVEKIDLHKYMNQKKVDFSNRNYSIGGQQSNTQFGTITNIPSQAQERTVYHGIDKQAQD